MFRRFLAWLKDPHGPILPVLWLATVAAAVGSIVLSVRGDGLSVPAVILSAAAAILLALSVYTIVRAAPHAKERILDRIRLHPKAYRFFRDYGFRTVAIGIFSMLLNMGYAVLQLVLAILLRSVWYSCLAAYYFCLAGLRTLLLVRWQSVKRRAESETDLAAGKLSLYRTCGIALTVLEIALTAAVTQMVLSKRELESTQIMAIMSAAYTFTRVVLAVFHVRKAGWLRDPLLQSFRNVTLTDAAVAMLSLETMMIATFGGEGESELLVLQAISGFAVCALTLTLGIWMIVRGTCRLRRLAASPAEVVTEIQETPAEAGAEGSHEEER